MTLCLRQRTTMDKRHEKCRRLEFELAGVLGFRASVVTPFTEKRERVKTLKREGESCVDSWPLPAWLHQYTQYKRSSLLRVPTYIDGMKGREIEWRAYIGPPFSAIFFRICLISDTSSSKSRGEREEICQWRQARNWHWEFFCQ